MDNREQVMDRIGRLLALADTTRNTSEHEAATAMAQAQRLMERYRVDAASLAEHSLDAADAIDEDVVDSILDAELGATLPKWRSILCMGIARSNGVRVYISQFSTPRGDRRIRLHMLGTAADANATRYMYAYAARQIDDLCAVAARANGNPGRTWAANFRYGAAMRTVERVAESARVSRKAEETAATARGAGSAIVLVSESRDRISLAIRVKEEALHLRSRRRGGVGLRFDAHGRAAGRSAGDKVNIGSGSGPATERGSRGQIGSGS